jgi:hypothetical protein
VRTLRRGERLTVRRGEATVAYAPIDGVASQPRRFLHQTFITTAEHIRVRLAPFPAGGRDTAEVCG